MSTMISLWPLRWRCGRTGDGKNDHEQTHEEVEAAYLATNPNKPAANLVVLSWVNP